MKNAASGRIVELFSGIQGEGIHVGRRHLFLRLAGCGFGCACCDQPEAREAPFSAMIERHPGRRDFQVWPSIMRPQDLAERIGVLSRRLPHHALAVTGGEPLEQPEFLAALLPPARGMGLKVLLETNGTRPDELAALLPHVDIVSMDIKLRSATGRPMPVQAHERFLRVALSSPAEVYVKAVVSGRTTVAELRRAAGLVARAREDVPLVLQPATRVPRRPRPPKPEALLALQAEALRILRDVRVIPQTHKIMDQR